MISAKGLCLIGAALGAPLALATPAPAFARAPAPTRAPAPAPIPAPARASAPTRIAQVHLYSRPQPLVDDVREQLTFVACGGPGRLLVRISERPLLSLPQAHRCRQRTVVWRAPASAATAYRVSVQIKIGDRPWSRIVSIDVGAPGVGAPGVGAPSGATGRVGVWITSADLHEALSPMPVVSFGAVNPTVPGSMSPTGPATSRSAGSERP